MVQILVLALYIQKFISNEQIDCKLSMGRWDGEVVDSLVTNRSHICRVQENEADVHVYVKDDIWYIYLYSLIELICLHVCLYVPLQVYVCLTVRLSLYLSVGLSARLSVCLSVFLSASPWIPLKHWMLLNLCIGIRAMRLPVYRWSLCGEQE